MTSRERVRKAVSHQQPDRVPLEFSARQEVVDKVSAYLNLKDGESLGDRLDLDLRGIGPLFSLPTHPLQYADPTIEVTPAGIHLDIWGVGFQPNQTSLGFYMDLAHSPLRPLTSIAQLDEHRWPSPDWWDYTPIPTQLEASKDYWTGAHSRGIFEISWFLRGFDTFLADLACDPDFAVAIIDRIQAYLFERTRRILEAGQGRIDMMEYNDDVGSQDGLLISPAMWREHLKPRMAEFCKMCRQYNAKVKYHSCGGVRDIIPDLIEIGVDVLNPVQALAAGMEPEGLKRDFGHAITFNGGIDTQDLLPHGTPQQMRDATRRLIDVVGKDGGLILAPSHVFQDDVPVENIIAVYETALGHEL